jgi:DDE superfamily endonuclease
MPRGEQRRVLTPGYNKRRNTFITLFWPKKRNGLVFNTYPKRRSREYKLHLSNLLQYAKRRDAKRVILFTDHAPCHKTKNVKKFIKDHPMLRVKLLPKRAPNLNPVERLVNKPLKSAVCTNRSYSDIDDVIRAGRRFLTKYKRTYGT